MAATDIKQKIRQSIQAFSDGNLTENALQLFQSLGYNTQRQAPLDKPDYITFKDSFIDLQSKFNENKALVKDWKYINLLFQLSKEEMSAQHTLFDTGRVDKTVFESYLFFAIELAETSYSRTALSQISREVNRLFPMPVMVLFKNGQYLTLAVINRRPHKRDEGKDVLEKVTLIKDIRIENPHRAHTEILFDLSFDDLKKNCAFTNFDQLHNAWQKTLDIKALNRKFYDDIFKWYLWAVNLVQFPQIRPEADKISDHAHQSESVIRLLTRLLFCWFLKEKNQLIREELFDKSYMYKLLKDFKGENGKNSIYYRAILQNLFFATLSVPIKARKYIREPFQGKNRDYGNPYVFRYQDFFVDPKENLKLFKDIPFLNGGLFECLDTVPETDDDIEIRLDGFSSNPKKQTVVPDFLFWGEHKGIDISQDFEDKKKSNETIQGIIDILNAYKFTIEENTPLEEEIALDPELLGKVFENLLASYNPETKKTARKQTGSFYTPREIVDYMVDESLFTYLKQKIDEINAAASEQKIRSLLSYAETHNPFNPKETEAIIRAIDSLKVIDLACGSGAFPVGVLNKLVCILRKIDPENKKWFEMIISRLPDYTQAEMRNKLADENWNYLRKLGIIQQAIYGVDIQPIAIQIAKLRFFISLIVDQTISNNPENNFGIQPLPNLDFKLVCADSLVGVPEENKATPGGLQFGEGEFFTSFNSLTSQYFSLSLPKEKKALSKKIDALIRKKADEKIAEIKSLSTHTDARYNREWEERNKAQIEQTQLEVRLWESYENIFKHGTVAFFETRYFFPEVEKGFDIAIGNPPYVQIQSYSGKPEQKLWEKQKYETYAKTGDVYCLFYERGYRLLKAEGVLTYITSNKWMRANYGKVMRKFLAGKTNPLKIIDFENYKVFESVTVNTNILMFAKAKNAKKLRGVTIGEDFDEATDIADYFNAKAVILDSLSEDSWLISSNEEYAVKKRIEDVGVPLKQWDIAINYGIKTGLNEAFIIDEKKKDELIAKDPKSAELIKPILRGRDIIRYKVEFADLWLIFIPWHFPLHDDFSISGSSQKAENEFKKRFPYIYEHLLKFKNSLQSRNLAETGIRYEWYALQRCAASYYPEFDKIKIVWGNLSLNAQFAFDDRGMFISAPCTQITPGNKYLLAVLNSSVGDYYIRSLGVTRNGGYFEYKPMFIENLPVPKISHENQPSFEVLVDCILFAKENNLSQESSTLEWVIDVMVYGLYFEVEMKKDHCYINDRIAEVIKPFKPDDTDAFKTEYIQTFAKFCKKDDIVYHGLVHSRNVKSVKIISGAKNEG